MNLLICYDIEALIQSLIVLLTGEHRAMLKFQFYCFVVFSCAVKLYMILPIRLVSRR